MVDHEDSDTIPLRWIRNDVLDQAASLEGAGLVIALVEIRCGKVRVW